MIRPSAYAQRLLADMADEDGEADFIWGARGVAHEDAFFAMESLQATLQQLEAGLRQRDLSEASSTEYCDSFCQALMHYAGSRNSVEHGLSLLEVYCLSINCFATARPHLTAESQSVALVLKRLALSCFELLLSVPQNDIPFEAWLQFHGSVQAAHEAMLQYGSTDLQALLQITGEGGAWSSPALIALLTGQPTDADEVNAYLALEGEDFLEMRIKHLEKVGEVEKALILTKACGNCTRLSGQGSFRQTFVTQLCQLLPSEEAITEISKLDAKDVLDIICNMETEGDENTAFILCTTYLTQQLQQERFYCSWELTLIWSKLQRRIDGSLESFIERCLQFGAIAKTVYHLLFLIRVIQTETMHFGLAVSVELCVKAFQLPRQEDTETKTTVCKTVACLLPDDLEVLRACQLTEFLLSPSREVFDCLEELYRRPDQKYDEENAIIPNSLRCELLLALKGHWPFDPEFWDWKTLKHYCIKLLGLEPEEEEGLAVEDANGAPATSNPVEGAVDAQVKRHADESLTEPKEKNRRKETVRTSQRRKTSTRALWTSERAQRWQQYKFLCHICHREVIEPRFLHHARKHAVSDVWTCPVCLEKFESRQEFVPHSKKHLRMPTRVGHLKKKNVKKKVEEQEFKPDRDEEDLHDLEPGQIPLDPSLVMYYQSTHDPVVLQHILEQAATVPKHQTDDDYITFDYIYTHYKLQDREVYHCPATGCSKNFRLFKYLGVHLKNDHSNADPNIKHYMEMKDRREKCTFCRRTFMTAHHHRKHRRVHYGEQPYVCVVTGCGACFATTNELLEHKHGHGFRLSYHCELTGCSVSFCDLGQLYHHEAQHFRDAAYTCTSPGCRKFYYSRKEFLMHLAAHGISFTEKDFEAQRKAKRKLLLPVVATDSGSEGAHRSSEGPSSTPEKLSLSQESERTKSLAHVAVCFDGKKFTCGLEKCGRTFNKAREIQKHLKMVHSDRFKDENGTCKKTKNEKRSKTRFTKGHKNSEDTSPTKGASQETDVPPAADAVPCDATISLNISTHACNPEIGGSLSDIVLGFSQLSLTSGTSRNVRRASRRQAAVSKGPRATPPATSPAKPTPGKIEPRSHPTPVSARRAPRKTEPPSARVLVTAAPGNKGQSENSVVVQQTARPYVCDVESCFYESVTSRALVQHYFRKHGYSKEDVEQMEIFNSLKFKPFKCHLCSKVYRERKELKIHCLHKHTDDVAVEAFRAKNKAEAPSSATPATSQQNEGEGSTSSSMGEVPAERIEPAWKSRSSNGDRPACKGKMAKSNGKVLMKDRRLRIEHLLCQEGVEDGTVQERRASRRLVRRGNSCVDVASVEDRPYPCVHKGCGAGFMKQCNLLRHLQNVHHYNSSQFCWEEDSNLHPCKHHGCNKRFYHLSSLYRHYRKDHQISEEPIPRFRCTSGNCSASYHLKSSLLRHTREIHQSEVPLEPTDPPSQCKFNGGYEKHVFYTHGDQTDAHVVRLQSACKRVSGNAGCQKKLIVTASSGTVKASERSVPLQPLRSCCEKESDVSQAENFESTVEAPEEEPDVKCVKPESKKRAGRLVYRTHEEALQMCQDRCLRLAYPCMIQNCDSVVSCLSSLHRHYVKCHKMARGKVVQNEDKLCYIAEQLEELIQKKSAVSAVPDLARIPNGVLKMEYQAEPENPGGPALPMSLHSIKTEPTGQETPEFSGEPSSDVAVLLDAGDLLYGENNGHTENILDRASPVLEDQTGSPVLEDQTKSESPAPPLVPPPPLDLSPPSTLRITVSDAALGLSDKPTNIAAAICLSASPSPNRQPLRWKNSELSEPLPAAPHPPAQKDLVSPSLAPRAFDIAGYKPLGFESSFLKFIQEKEENHKGDKLRSTGVLNPCCKPDSPRRRDCCRRNCSVKENNQRGPARSRRSRSSPLKPLLSAGECSSIQNLRFILERALRGCGDQAIKQLQFLKPVVVLERPKTSASLLDLLPPEAKA
ncbi:LOW QUALITY PROTEIN: zinc finger protein Rlf [Electrophorus electricus]|uniref:LOW QUALITY PROTEIN: zinc finger protein Rlf n=1 Tax=Electrophorus electricus TaxID=8005 RepID=UPI0015D0813A|nr:LOW QUALITY PROTEIN: zinc finger protein Rlf [Electrophorus electricus]